MSCPFIRKSGAFERNSFAAKISHCLTQERDSLTLVNPSLLSRKAAQKASPLSSDGGRVHDLLRENLESDSSGQPVKTSTFD